MVLVSIRKLGPGGVLIIITNTQEQSTSGVGFLPVHQHLRVLVLLASLQSTMMVLQVTALNLLSRSALYATDKPLAFSSGYLT